MSEQLPEHDLSFTRQSVMDVALRHCMKHESLRVVFEQTPKAILGGTMVFLNKDAPDAEYLVTLCRYDATIDMPSEDGAFYDMHIVSRDGPDGDVWRFVLSDVTAHYAEPLKPLENAVVHEQLSAETYSEVCKWLAYTSFDDQATTDALQYLQWWHLVAPIGTIDQEQPDMPLYNYPQILKQEWQGS